MKLNINFARFLQSIEIFSKQKLNFNSLKTLIENGLEIYQFNDKIFKKHVYLLNKENYFFEHFLSLPKQENYLDLLEFFNDEVHLNLALSSGEIQTFQDGTNGIFYFIIPLISFDGILGLIILECDCPFLNLEIVFISMLSLYSSYFANQIDVYLTKQNEKKTQDILDQIVATKTLELKESHSKLGEKLNNLTSNLSMIIPHEIRTPINQILGSTNYLKKYLSTLDLSDFEDLNEILSDIDNSTQRLRSLTENYIYYANLVVISSNINEIKKIQSEVTQSTSSVIFDSALMTAYRYNRKEDLKINLIDIPISMTESFLVKIIDEIVDNAMKFSGSGSLVTVSSFVENNFYVIDCKDQGIGMNEEEIKQVGPYVQFNRNINEQQGSGMGLSIVSKLLNLHNGKFEIKSIKGKFTEVIVKIPLNLEKI